MGKAVTDNNASERRFCICSRALYAVRAYGYEMKEDRNNNTDYVGMDLTRYIEFRVADGTFDVESKVSPEMMEHLNKIAGKHR